MNLETIPQDVAKDLIELINSLKGIRYDKMVSYNKTSFKYVSLDAIYKRVKVNNNFAVMEPLGTNERGESALKVVLIHKSGTVISSDYYRLRVPENGSKQDEGSAITYTKRYAIGSFLGLCTDEDNDANPTGNGMPLNPPPPRDHSNKSTKSDTGQTTNTGGKPITPAQRSRLFALAKNDQGRKPDDIVKTVVIKYGYSSTKDILTKDYEIICEAIEKEAQMSDMFKAFDELPDHLEEPPQVQHQEPRKQLQEDLDEIESLFQEQ